MCAGFGDKSVVKFSLSTFAFEYVAYMHKRRSHASAAVAGKELYVFGGRENGIILAGIEALDVSRPNAYWVSI